VAQTKPLVRDGILLYQADTREETISVGSDAWRAWLDDALTTDFRVWDPHGSFTVRKERRQRGDAYWYAYRRREGRLIKRYLGRSRALTRESLEIVAARLDAGPLGPTRRFAPSPQNTRPLPQLDPARAVDTPEDVLLAYKLYMAPARDNLVPRPRLTERLSAGLRGPLTLIVAPAG
jgi:LuxR family maltose regulon positive regulatory protein